MKVLLLILVISISVSAQTIFPENNYQFGTFDLQDDAGRICLATNSTDIPVCWSTLTFSLTNGPSGEVNYKNHTFGLSYNMDFNGNKVVSDTLSFTFNNEPKFHNGITGATGHFMSEHYFNWVSPDGSINIRPFGWNVQYDTGNTDFAFRGEMRFFRHPSNGGGLWGLWHDDGYLDLTTAPSGQIGFKNNSVGLSWLNAAGDNSISPVYVDGLNRVIIGGGQAHTVVTSQNLSYTSTVSRGDIQILGEQCGPIQEAQDKEDVIRAVNEVIRCMAQHGLAEAYPIPFKS